MHSLPCIPTSSCGPPPPARAGFRRRAGLRSRAASLGRRAGRLRGLVGRASQRSERPEPILRPPSPACRPAAPARADTSSSSTASSERGARIAGSSSRFEKFVERHDCFRAPTWSDPSGRRVSVCPGCSSSSGENRRGEPPDVQGIKVHGTVVSKTTNSA